jgi:hypothetical protein
MTDKVMNLRALAKKAPTTRIVLREMIALAACKGWRRECREFAVLVAFIATRFGSVAPGDASHHPSVMALIVCCR